MKTLKCIILFSLSLILFSCNEPDSKQIVGTWVSSYGTLELSKNGDYYWSYSYGGIYQYRRGHYSYNSSQKLLTVDIDAVAGNNYAYTTTYLVQTLNSTNLVLVDIETGDTTYYTRQ